MAIIYTYGFDDNVQDNDAWVGTNSGNRKTKQFTALSVANYMNTYARVSIGGQMSYKLTSSSPGLGEMTVVGGGDGTNFVDIEFLNISTSDLSGAQVTEFLDYLVSTGLLISHQNNPSTFGHYTVVAYTPTADPSVYKLELGILGGNGKVFLNNYYDLSPLNLAGGTGSGVTTVDTSEGSFITLTPTTPTAGNVLITADLSATGTPDATTFLRGDNTWAVAGEVDGSGTTNYVSKWQDPTTLTDSVIYDDGTNVGIGTTSPNSYPGYTALTLDNSNKGGIIDLEKASTRIATLNVNDGNFNIVNVAASSMILFTSFQERVRINSSGNVGIGTTSPGAKLDVNGDIMISGGYNTSQSPSLNAMIYKNTSGTGDFLRSGDLILEPRAGSSLIVTNNGTNQFIVNNAGNVGIGTTSPSERLHIIGTTNTRAIIETQVNGGSSALRLDANPNYWEIKNYGPSAYLGITRGTNEYITIDNSGNVGIGTTSPSRKLEINSGTTNVVASFISTDSYAGISFSDNTTTNDSAVQVRSFGDELRLVAGSNDRLVITSAGNVGIGTTTPSDKLDVNGAIRFTSTSNSAVNGYSRLYTLYSLAKGETYIAPEGTTNPTRFFPNGGVVIGATALLPPANGLLVSGNVGIGTNIPSQKLHVNGNARLTGAFYDSNNSAGAVGQVLTSTSTSTEWTDPGSITQVPVPITAFAGGSLALAATVNFVYFSWLGGSGIYTLNLPSAVTYPYKVIRFVTDGGTSASNKIHIQGSGGQTVDGGVFYTLDKAYNGVQVWSDGSEWIVIQAKAT